MNKIAGKPLTPYFARVSSLMGRSSISGLTLMLMNLFDSEMTFASVKVSASSRLHQPHQSV